MRGNTLNNRSSFYWSLIILAISTLSMSATWGDSDIDDLIKEVKAEMSKNKSDQENPLDLSGLTSTASPELSLTLEEYKTEQLQWHIYKYEHARKTFNFHHLTTILTFILVHLIVIVGLYLTWLQFHRDSGSDPGAEPHELSIGKDGLKIRSSVIGLIVLALSLGFYYLYLKNVYPVTYVSSNQSMSEEK